MAEAVMRLLLPGTLCDARLFAPMQQAWAQGQHPAALARVADLHGLGMDARQWCLTELERLPDSFDLLGFSLGGVLALMFLALAPQRVRRLVLVASNPQAATAQHRLRVDEQRSDWQTMGPAAMAANWVRQVTPAAQVAAIEPVVVDMAAASPWTAFVAQGELNASRADGCAALAAWRGPLLLLSGADDPWCGADKQRLALQARPDARWHELSGCGHYLPLERAGELARLSAEFLN
jgi:pimeloyl-ACP methyl ester carboxylesterase